MDKGKKNYPLKKYYQEIYEKYDLVNRIFTFGQDKVWRKKAVAACLENSPDSVLDICTGTGDFILQIAKETNKDILLTGYDFSAEMLSRAREKNSDGNRTINFIEGDVASMPFENAAFDNAGITFGIRNLVYENSNASRHLSEIHRVLKPGGRFIILESSKPESGIWRLFNNLYLRLILPYLGGIISGNLKAYRYLATSSRDYYTRKEMTTILEDAGFTVLRSKSLFMGSVMLLVALKQVNQ